MIDSISTFSFRSLLKKSMLPVAFIGGFALVPTVVIMLRLWEVNGGNLAFAVLADILSACSFVALTGWYAHRFGLKSARMAFAAAFAALLSLTAIFLILGIPSARKFWMFIVAYAAAAAIAAVSFVAGKYLSRIIIARNVRMLLVCVMVIIAAYFAASVTYLPFAFCEIIALCAKS